MGKGTDYLNITRLVIFIILLVILFVCTGQRSPVDLRDSTEINKPNVIIVECDCTCDTIPKIDTIPII